MLLLAFKQIDFLRDVCNVRCEVKPLALSSKYSSTNDLKCSPDCNYVTLYFRYKFYFGDVYLLKLTTDAYCFRLLPLSTTTTFCYSFEPKL